MFEIIVPLLAIIIPHLDIIIPHLDIIIPHLAIIIPLFKILYHFSKSLPFLGIINLISKYWRQLSRNIPNKSLGNFWAAE